MTTSGARTHLLSGDDLSLPAPEPPRPLPDLHLPSHPRLRSAAVPGTLALAVSGFPLCAERTHLLVRKSSGSSNTQQRGASIEKGCAAER